MKLLYYFCAAVILTGCNSMYIKPNTMDKTQTVYTDRGGYSMKRSIKERMEERGYKVIVGKETHNHTYDNGDSILDLSYSSTMDARYIIRVNERKERLAPVWCVFNGFWWWNFNVSIADQKTGEELLTWRGRGCANSSLNKLETALDELEITDKR